MVKNLETIVTEHLHIAKKTSSGEPVVKGTNVSVRAIAELWLQGAQPEEIILHIPHLSMAELFDALSYYEDHKEEINSYISKNSVPGEISDTSLP